MTFFLSLAGGIYLLDLITKIAVRQTLPLGSEIRVLPFFSLVHIENTGIAFGLFQGRNTLFLLMGIVILVGMTWLGWRSMRTDRVSGLLMATILGGALGNLTDRFVHGRVTDFLDFYWKTLHWPAFNVADSAICVGAILLLLREFMCSRSSLNSAQ